MYFIVIFFPGTKDSRQVDLDLPNNVVEGSARAFFTVVGKLNVLFHNNLENLSFFFLGLLSRHMEVPRLWVKLELQLPAYATATAVPDLGHICSLCQCQILNPLSKARDQTHLFTNTMSGS